MQTPSNFGDLLRRARRYAGLTQEALAERAGISVRAVIDLERGVNRAPRRDSLGLLADALALSAEERAQWEQLRQRLAVRGTDRPEDMGRAAKLRVAPTNLPTDLNALIGRDDDQADLLTLLRAARLVTLTGPGGIGKTRLALSAGRASLATFPDGVYLVDLAPVREPSLVEGAIARALGVREQPGQAPLAALIARIGQRRMLLILDNFEQVIEAAPVATELLAACPSLTLLVTSRQRLRLRGEREFPVAALATPATWCPVTAANLPEYGATRLFLERGRELMPDLVVTDATATIVAAICARLDGIPLAIELAAARSKVLSPAALLERLSSSLDVLAGGSRDLPERHRTLRQTIAWSYGLLSPREQELLQRLSVFAGGWTLEAAEAVCDELAIDVLDGLATLVDHSLVRQLGQSDGSLRFELLGTVRSFAREQLDAADLAADTRDRHAAWFLRFAEARDDLFESAGARRYAWLDELACEQDNLRLALQRYLDRSEVEQLLRLAAALVWFWTIRGYLSEGRRWLAHALTAGGNALPAVRAAALLGLGMLATEQRDWEASEPALAESLDGFRRLGHGPGIVASLNNQAVGAAHRGDRATAHPLFTDALAAARELNVRPAIGGLLNNLGVMCMQAGDIDRARALYGESLVQHRAMGLRHYQGGVLLNLGWISVEQGEWSAAEQYFLDALEIARQLSNEVGTIVALNALGWLALQQGRVVDAREVLLESLDRSRELGSVDEAAQALEVLAMVAVAWRALPEAVQLFAAAQTVRTVSHAPNNPQDAQRIDQALDEARQALDSTMFARAWTEGMTLRMDEAGAIAAALEPAESAAELPVSEPPGAAPGNLSDRELEVLRLVIDGRSNAEIAGMLFISTHTVASHVAHIMNKVGVPSRTAAAAWGVRNGLG